MSVNFRAWIDNRLATDEPEPFCLFSPMYCDRAYTEGCYTCGTAKEAWDWECNKRLHEAQLTEYTALMGEINNAALCIHEWAENHGETLPEDLTWYHIGKAHGVRNALRKAVKRAGIEVKSATGYGGLFD